MKCKKCGTQVDDQAKFCPVCGEALHADGFGGEPPKAPQPPRPDFGSQPAAATNMAADSPEVTAPPADATRLPLPPAASRWPSSFPSSPVESTGSTGSIAWSTT